MSEVKVNKISPRSGTNVQLGDSGDTITIPSGATLDTSNSTVTLPDGSVTTAKIADSNITTAKLADANITTAKLAYDPNPFRNIVINGDMSIAQRGTSFTGQTGANYIVDRFTQNINGTFGTWTNGQETDAPANTGFQKSLFMNCTTADAAPAAADFVRVEQRFEGQMLQYLKKGTSSAESLTLSFWVKSPKTGTHIAELEDRDNSRYVSQSYTINAANTWEFKTATFPADTTGTLNNDNGESLRLNFYLGAGTDWSSGTLGTTWHTTAANRAAGQVNVGDAIHSSGNYWQITGVQLEAGTTASDFEFLPYDVSLNRCLRYFEKIANGSEDADAVIGSGGYVYQTNVLGVNYQWYPKRAAPSIYQSSGTNYFRYQRDGLTEDFNSIKIYIPNSLNGLIYSDDGFTGTSGSNGWVQLNSASAYLGLQAEL